jgi:hypothetical protein
MLSNNSFVQLPKSNMCETKNDGMTKKPTNKKNELHNKRKRFT